MDLLVHFAVTPSNGPVQWSAIDLTIWHVLALVVLTVIYFALFKFSTFSIFMYILGLIVLGILLGGKFIGENQTKFWIEGGIVGFLCFVYYYFRQRKR